MAAAPHRHEGINMTHGDPADSDALRIQWQQALEFLRQQNTIAVQAFGFLITADILLVAYGMSQRIASAFALASLMPLASVAVVWLVLDVAIPCTFVVLQLEQQLLPGQSTLSITVLRITTPNLYSQLMAASQVEDMTRRDQTIRKAKRSYLTKTPILPIAITIFALHISIFVFALALADYRIL